MSALIFDNPDFPRVFSDRTAAQPAYIEQVGFVVDSISDKILCDQGETCDQSVTTASVGKQKRPSAQECYQQQQAAADVHLQSRLLEERATTESSLLKEKTTFETDKHLLSHSRQVCFVLRYVLAGISWQFTTIRHVKYAILLVHYDVASQVVRGFVELNIKVL